MRGLAAFQVYSDTLYVDFDNNEAAAEEFRKYLHSHDCIFEAHRTGGRSVHFHVSIEPMYGRNVPESQKAWMEEVAPEADMSIYRHSGLYRLPGTYHAKNPGNSKKCFEKKSSGVRLAIPNRPRVRTSDMLAETSDIDYHKILGKLLHMSVGEGGRHPHMFKIAAACKKSDKDEIYAKRLLNMWNYDNCVPPKADWEIDKLIRWVYNNV
jgi:hypothetical protein